MQPLQFDGRSHGSVRHQRTSTEELRALGASSFSLLASGLSFGTAKGEDLSRPAEGTCRPGRDHPGMVGDILSERWAELSRNGWAASFRNHGRLAPESAPMKACSRMPSTCSNSTAGTYGASRSRPARDAGDLLRGCGVGLRLVEHL